MTADNELLAVMRPLAMRLEGALRQLLAAGVLVPTEPVPRIEVDADGSGRQWIDAQVDFRRLRLDAMNALEGTSELLRAETLVAHKLGLDPQPRLGGEWKWTPEGQIIDVFLEDYLSAAYGHIGNLHIPEKLASPDDHAEKALAEQSERLNRFLREDSFTGQLVTLLGSVRLGMETLPVAPGITVVPFSASLRDVLWRAAGWGSTATQPLQFNDLVEVAHAIMVEVTGARLGGWNWAAAQDKVERARLALLICGAKTARVDLSWLQVDRNFASYLTRLGAGSGLVRQASASRLVPGSELTDEQTARLPEVYAHLANLPQSGSLQLALRRLSLSSERQSLEDRLIDTWIAFEALFAQDATTELRFRASLRIARYVGRDTEARRELFRGLRQSYDWRSHLVHGGAPQQAKQKLGTLEEAVTVSEQALRTALQQWLAAPPSRDLREIDEQLLQ